MMNAALIRAVLALYPRGIRDRYAPEITDLLAASSTPWRDMADTIRSALGERVHSAVRGIATAHPRDLAHAVMSGFLMIVGLGGGAFGLLLLLLFLLLLLPPGVVAFAVLAGLIVGRARSPWWWAAPVAASLTVVAVSVIPQLGMTGVLGNEVGMTRAVAVGCWAAGLALLIGLLSLVTRLTRPLRLARRWARCERLCPAGLAVAGGLLLLELVSMVLVTQLFTVAQAPRQHAWLWYWTSMLPLVSFDIGGIDPVNGLGAGSTVPDALELLPPILTVCLAFVLACVYAHQRQACRPLPAGTPRR